ncbi:deoxyhypusine synthase [bacterium]|nr:deoxyhypusine synthase [bacterium]MBU1072820.1 deoxyhypusine synthase [bacterium]MBU1676311.1 deoxyhypusine synthase [bacterium]
MQKKDVLQDVVRHVDVTSFDARMLVDAFRDMSFQARNLARAADIFDRMLADRGCGVILTLAGSLCSAGLKDAIALMIDENMVDVVVSTGANIVDQDFFEALGFRHYKGSPHANDQQLRKLAVDRIYDTYIDEDELRVCDMTIAGIAGGLPARPHSSREFITAMGAYLDDKGVESDRSIVHSAYRKGVPIFCPAFSDCSAGFGLLHHQWHKDAYLTIDSVADFRELTQIKLALAETGILMVGGGVPKNFTQDVVVATEILGEDRPMHRYAVQITVADERDGALSGSTLKEACSWGKVDTSYEQMVYGEATVLLPLLASDAWHRGSWRERAARRLNDMFAGIELRP